LKQYTLVTTYIVEARDKAQASEVVEKVISQLMADELVKHHWTNVLKEGEWYFDVSSGEYGPDILGPYPTLEEAEEAVKRVQRDARELQDDIDRRYSAPYEVK
jgi:hypothetical protein